MINEIRAQALAHAMELAKRAEELEASSIVKNASAFEAYLCGAIPCPASIDDAAGSSEPSLDLGACNAPISNWNRGQVLPLREGEFLGNDKDQPLTGCSVADCAHSNSSSVQDGESVGELPTPSRTETVAAPGDTEEAARTHGGAA
ncbi:class III extradiol ring-cleavage dioxygenase family protein [Acetobacter lambici]|uniref:Uncharacterized protein n=1 Tax=Acetobacter lambici TaxID=1332824 RepID=A0ABT1F057_9PROT|nr:hypothetical protein [Acetobacter lambici]MCP1243018.1 hypothetical protein [Acetobacter lambici]MCP1258528.1 hypothetical protein [Acetobacter lambici]